MIIEVDTDALTKSNISVLQFIIGYFLLSKDYKKLEDIIKEISNTTFNEILKTMEDNRLLNNLNKESFSYDNIIIRNRFIKLIKDYSPEDLFDDILKIYPVKVQRPDGTFDYLRTDLQRCRKLYNNTIVKNSFRKHERILKALKYEIEIRTLEGSLKYMKRLPKWLNSEDWKIYEERMKDTTTNHNTETYGTELE